MNSSYGSSNEIQRQSSKSAQPIKTNKSLYAENKGGEQQEAQYQKNLANANPEEICHLELMPGKKQAPACCTVCNIF